MDLNSLKRKSAETILQAAKRAKVDPKPVCEPAGCSWASLSSGLFATLEALKAKKAMLKRTESHWKQLYFRRAGLTAVQSKVQFLWVRACSPLYLRLFNAVLREICSYTTDLKLFSFLGKAVFSFDPLSRVWSVLQFDSASVRKLNGADFERCCYNAKTASVDCNRFIVISYCSAYDMKVAQGKVSFEQLPQTQRMRPNAGLIVYNGAVFLFGGEHYVGRVTPQLADRRCIARSIERLALAQGENWTILTSRMKKARRAFTPCVHSAKAYLASKSDKSLIEVFNLATFAFEQPLLLNESISEYAVMFVIGQDLIIFSQSVSLKVAIVGGAKAIAIAGKDSDLISISSPVVVGPAVFWLGYSGCYRTRVDKPKITVKKHRWPKVQEWSGHFS